MKTKIMLVIAALGAAGSGLAQSIEFVVVDRQVNFVQTVAGSAGLDGATPYEFLIDVNGTSLTAPPFTFTLKKPGDAVTVYTSIERSTGTEWEAPGFGLRAFSSMANLQSTFPDGAYTIQTNLGNTSALSIPNLIGSTNDGFANTPFIIATQNSNPVTWSGGKMLIDPTQELTLTSTVFADNYVMATGRIGLWLDYGMTGQEVTNETAPGSFIFNAASVQMQILANTLSPGTYNGVLEFNNIVGAGLVDLSATYGAGAKGVSVYTAYTSFQIQAVPEPSTYAAIFGALALLGVLLRRRGSTA